MSKVKPSCGTVKYACIGVLIIGGTRFLVNYFTQSHHYRRLERKVAAFRSEEEEKIKKLLHDLKTCCDVSAM